jgi:CBS domain-containing protein
MARATRTAASRSTRATGRSPVAAADRTPITQVMTPFPQTVWTTPDVSVESVREAMLKQGISRLPVLDEVRKPIGIISVTDLVVDEHESGGEIQEEANRDELPGPGFHVHGTGKSVGDVMSKSVLTVPESASVAQAAETLVAHHLHGAPVCSKSRAMVGFVSSSDLLAWLAGLR